MLIYLIHSVDEAGVPKIESSILSKSPIILNGCGHNFVEGRVDNINFIGTLDILIDVGVTHQVKQLNLTLLVKLLGHLTWRYVINILEPLEVGACHTTSICKKIWRDLDASFDEDLFTGEGCWTVGSLKHSLALDVWGISFMDGLLDGSWDKVIDRSLQP